MSHSPLPTPSQEGLIDEKELASRLKTSIPSVRWMRRTGRISYIKIAGNRKVRFDWLRVLEDLRTSEVRANFYQDARANQLADIASTGDEDNASCAAADLFREASPSLS